MLRRKCPPDWRKGFSLYRRRIVTGAAGEPESSYDMAHPDFTAADGSDEGICWQGAQSWQQSRGQVTAGWKPTARGEMPAGVVEGRVFSALKVEPFDRLIFDGGLYEVRSVQRWPRHRKLILQQIGREASS